MSYNVYPGWHLRGILRDAMLFHIGGEADPQEGIRKARELLDFLVQFPLGTGELLYDDAPGPARRSSGTMTRTCFMSFSKT